MKWMSVLGGFLFSAVLAIAFAWGAHMAPDHSLLEAICGIFAMAAALIGIIVTGFVLMES